MCGNCHSEARSLWAIGPPYPTFEKVEAGNFAVLNRCAECGQLWLESMYEPFAAFRYAVKWPASVARFKDFRDVDQSATLCKWHEAEVRSQAIHADEATLALIRAHHERARGAVDLMPSSRPNEIQI